MDGLKYYFLRNGTAVLNLALMNSSYSYTQLLLCLQQFSSLSRLEPCTNELFVQLHLAVTLFATIFQFICCFTLCLKVLLVSRRVVFYLLWTFLQLYITDDGVLLWFKQFCSYIIVFYSTFTKCIVIYKSMLF